MKQLRFQHLALLFVLVLCNATQTSAQIPDASVLWIKVYGQPPAFANMRFGNSVINTFGLDTAATFPSEFREQEPPPLPPGFDCVWAKIRTGQFGTFRGLLDRDFRGATSSVQKDTFKLSFCQCDNPTATISFKWPDCNYLYNRCDSIFLVDPTGHIPRINMLNQDSLTIPAAGDSGIFHLYIFKYGVFSCYDCYRECLTNAEDDISLPDKFEVAQNYPNPFNPTTEITYEVAQRSHVLLRIFDVLGREVATLVNEVKAPGEYTVQWDARQTAGGQASNVTSGVYFYRVQAEKYIETKKMLLIK